MRQSLALVIKVFLFLALFSIAYYLTVLQPRNALANSVAEQHTTLLQNKLAFEELSALDPNQPSFNLEKSNLVGIIRQTNNDGVELAGEAQLIYEKQNKLLEKVFATESYEEGIKILSSDESIDLLAEQTELILEFEQELARLKN